MSFLDWLKRLVTAKNGIIKVDLRKFINIPITIIKNSEANLCEYNEGEKTLQLNLEKLDSEESSKFKKALKSAVVDEDQILLENKASQLIEDFKEKDATSQNQKVLNFFQNKILPKDYEALRASLYLRSKYDEGVDVYQLKTDIITKYGERGKNISNMCTAGYFEKWLIPLYKEMEQSPDFSIDKFQFTYDIIVKESAFAVFVHRDMRGEKVKATILGKIHTNLEYGIKFVTIHGIGKENKKKIKETIAELESEHSFLRRSVEEEGSAIIARIQIK